MLVLGVSGYEIEEEREIFYSLCWVGCLAVVSLGHCSQLSCTSGRYGMDGCGGRGLNWSVEWTNQNLATGGNLRFGKEITAGLSVALVFQWQKSTDLINTCN